MLVLARGQGQSVVLDGRIIVTVLETRGGVVRLGIDAPCEVGVRRGELAAHARRAGTAAAAPDVRSPDVEEVRTP
jgi:carbon storage regulator